MVALRDHLCPDENGAFCPCEPLEPRAKLLGLGDSVRVEPNPFELGNVPLELALEPLCPRSDPSELGRAARRTRLARELAGTAVMAAESPVSMQRERDVAVRAAASGAARPAMERRRDATPVEEQNPLASPLCEPAELGEERRGERVARLVPQVDDAYGWDRRGDTPTELETLERMPRLRPRGGGAEDGYRALECGALRGDGAGVVARIRLLLVRGVVLLVDADDPQRRERREHGRARTHDNRSLAGGDPLPLVPPSRLRQARVEERDAVAETGQETPERLRRQGDLRHEDDGAATGGQGGL